MTDEQLVQVYGAAYAHLKKKNVYDLRVYGRTMGVVHPTALKKEELILSIIRIASGATPAPVKSRRGARPKSRALQQSDWEEMKELFGWQGGVPRVETNPVYIDVKCTRRKYDILADLVQAGYREFSARRDRREVSLQFMNEVCRVLKKLSLLCTPSDGNKK